MDTVVISSPRDACSRAQDIGFAWAAPRPLAAVDPTNLWW
jgi:hypothetical protein